MNLDDRIAKLQALLARVQGRSRSPHRANGGPNGGPAAPPVPVVPAVVLREAPAPPLSASLAVTAAPPPPVLTAVPPSPPQPFAPAPSAPRVRVATPVEPLFAHEELPLPTLPPPRPEHSGVRVVDPPPMPVVELDVDPDPLPEPLPPPESFSDLSLPGDRPSQAADAGPAAADETLESRSRLVAAAAVVEEDEGAAASDPTIEVAAAEVSSAELVALQGLAEDIEAPSSSRRPISLEQKMSEPEEEAPLHPPPPESGKLPAASPAIDLTLPEPRPREAAPEPVREARKEAEAPAAPAPRETAAKASPASHEEAQVARFVGVPPNADAMKTFGEILDEALAL